MIYKISITLKNSGKIMVVFVEKTKDNEIFEINETMCRAEWLIIKGFDRNPLRVSKELAARRGEIAGIEIIQDASWDAETVENFRHPLKSEESTKDERS